MTTEEKNIWRDCMKPSQREIEKKDIANLQNKADFLKNPRFCDTPKYLINGNMKDADRYGSFYDERLSPNFSELIHFHSSQNQEKSRVF